MPEKFNAGETIIEHVSNSGHDHPLLRLPTIMGIDFSVTKHVFMLWLIAGFVFLVVTATVRRYLKQDKPVPGGFMNALEAVVVFIRDEIVQPNVGRKWVSTWTPLILTFFLFILCANALGGWIAELETRGKGKSADIDKELHANVLPGVVIVPAMVIAIEKAQEAGIRYNRQ